MRNKSFKRTSLDHVLGINRRNLEYIYPYNPRCYFPLANDKALMKELFADKNIPIPPSYITITLMGEISPAWDILNALEEFVIKPSKGKTGNGILVLKKNANGSWNSPSGTLYSTRDLEKHIADILFGVFSYGLHDKAIIEYKVNLHPALAKIYDRGVCDIRVILFKQEIVLCMARIPTDKANGRANLHQGAIGVGVDMKKGLFTQGYDKEQYLTRHPDTGVKLTGFVIPHWRKILSISKDAAQAVPLEYLGVDIVIDADKGPLVLEINARPGLEIQNVNQTGLQKILRTLT